MKYEPTLRIADDGTKIYQLLMVSDTAISITFQRLGIDAEPISLDVQEVHETGAVLSPFPVHVTAPQEAAIHQALVEWLVV